MPKRTKGKVVDGYDPSSWPDPRKTMFSQSLNNLNQYDESPTKYSQPRPAHDSIVDENILRMVQHCRSLQLRVEVYVYRDLFIYFVILVISVRNWNPN